MANRPEAVWTWFGTLLAGGQYVPLNRAHRGEILADMLARSGADTVVTDEAGLEQLRSAGDQRALRVLLIGDGTPPEGASLVAPWAEVAAAKPGEPPSARPSDVAELIYTSGTTGRSKAVAVTHNQLCRGAGWISWSLESDETDITHAWLPLFHIGGQVNAVLSMVVVGGQVALYPTFSRSRFWNEVDESQASIFIGLANVIELLWSRPARPNEAANSLRAGIVGGIPPHLHRAFETRFGVRLYESYGMTEAEPLVLPPPGRRYPVGSCGLPVPDFEIEILDDDDEIVASDVVGQIAVRPRRPNVVTPGYEHDDAASLAAFRNLWFHTGDVGRKDDEGFVYFLDRMKHAIRRRGENISSWELENIIGQYPGVRECTAVGIPSPLGEEDVKVVVAVDMAQSFNPGELREWCRARMAAFMVPRYIEIVDELPRDAIGKIAKRMLAEVTATTWDGEAESAVPSSHD